MGETNISLGEFTKTKTNAAVLHLHFLQSAASASVLWNTVTEMHQEREKSVISSRLMYIFNHANT